MDRQEADERYARLLENVAATRDLLDRVGADHWSGWMATVYAELGSLNAYGLTRLLGAYGGMGSLNDLVIHPVNGHSILDNDVDRVNGSLDALRTALYADATALHTDLRRNDSARAHAAGRAAGQGFPHHGSEVRLRGGGS